MSKISSSFAGFPTGTINMEVWTVGPPNSIVSADTAIVKNSSRCLTAGQEYEIEGAMACAGDRARAVATIQFITRITPQLTPPIDPALLGELTPRITCLAPQKVPVLYATGEPAERQLGIKTEPNISPVEENTHSIKRGVTALRAEGWEGAIALPSCHPNVCGLVIPRRFAGEGRLLVVHSGKTPGVPTHLVEYTLGQCHSFPLNEQLQELMPSSHLSYGEPLSPRRARATRPTDL